MEAFKIRQKDAREKWLNLRKENPKLSKNNLRKLDEATHTWLIRYDKKWMYDNTSIIKNHNKPIDWNQRDEEFLPKVKKVVIKMNEGRPERILWTTIGGRLGINGWFSKNKNKLPKIKAYLDDMEESLQDFHVRKMEWAIDELENEDINISKWKLIEKSGVNIGYIDDIRDELCRILREKGYNEDLLN